MKVAWNPTSAGAEIVLAVGNTWNTTQAAVAGHYTDGTIVTGANTGTNFDLPVATSRIKL